MIWANEGVRPLSSRRIRYILEWPDTRSAPTEVVSVDGDQDRHSIPRCAGLSYHEDLGRAGSPFRD